MTRVSDLANATSVESTALVETCLVFGYSKCRKTSEAASSPQTSGSAGPKSGEEIPLPHSSEIEMPPIQSSPVDIEAINMPSIQSIIFRDQDSRVERSVSIISLCTCSSH